MHAPVDQHAAAGVGFSGKGPAEAGDGAVRPERAVNLVHIPQLTGVDHLFNFVDRGVKAIAHPDVEDFAVPVGGGLHGIDHFHAYRSRLFAQHVFAGVQAGDGDGGMGTIGSADGNGLYLLVAQNVPEIYQGMGYMVLFGKRFGARGDDVAEILDLYRRVFGIARYMLAARNRPAADHGYFRFIHG